MIIAECVGVNMDFHIPVLIIDGDHVRAFSNPYGHTLNRRVVSGFMEIVLKSYRIVPGGKY
jgi:hypothetical protein